MFSVLTVTWDGGVSALVAGGQQAPRQSNTQYLEVFFKVPKDTEQVIHGPAPLEVIAYGRTYG
ncbi:MAG TPA: hypothetical protein VFG99_10730, partial [Chloroflexia bacterium]|nr:hypothetical protein [Chloroflexia bacterium]